MWPWRVLCSTWLLGLALDLDERPPCADGQCDAAYQGAALLQRQTRVLKTTIEDTRFISACAADGGRLWTQYEKLQQTKDDRVLVYVCDGSSGCEGVGNQLRGITVAFYIAMITRRAFYIQWEHSAVAHNRIDWRLPSGSLPNECKGADRVGTDCTRRGGSCEESSSALLHEDASCLHMRSKAVPSIWWEYMVEGSDSDLLSPLRRAVAEPEFLLGCALNFLFDFSGMERALVDWRALGLGSPTAPLSYVAVHMRWGDEHLRAHGTDELGIAEKEKTRAALFCALELGADLFSKGQRWSIFVASDSMAARRYALEEATKLHMSVYENDFEPMHVSFAGVDDMWSVWGDLVTLLGEAGLVTAGGAHSAAWDDSLLTNGFSDYSQSAAQYSLVPFSRQRVVLDDLACRVVTPADVQVVI